jgi:hypothetical protein
MTKTRDLPAESKGLKQGNLISFDFDSSAHKPSQDILVTPYAVCNMTDTDIYIERYVIDQSISRSRSSSKPKSEVVLTVKPNEQINLSVDYEKQINKQLNNYSGQQSNANDEVVSVSFGRSNKAPIKDINLNKLGLVAEKHTFGNT